jgi:selenocysteine lyase/cysteine desulfurase
MPIADRLTYVNTAQMSPLPRAAVDALAADAELASLVASGAEDARIATAARVRGQVAVLLGAPVDDVAFTRGTTDGLGLVAAGLDWQEGDVVVLPAHDHPSTELPWRARTDAGVSVVRTVDVGEGGVSTDAFADAIERADGRVRVLALSWVHADSGRRADVAALAALAHDQGAVLCLDAIQAAGVVPCDLLDWGVDAAALGAQKWLMGPHGLGVAAISGALRERLRVAAPGRTSVVDLGGDPLTYVDSARRFEGGAINHGAISALGASLEILLAAGIDDVWDWVQVLRERLLEGLDDLGLDVSGIPRGDEAGAIATVSVPGLPAEEAVARLAAEGVVASARGGGVRLSPHGWNTSDDVDVVLAEVAGLLDR